MTAQISAWHDRRGRVRVPTVAKTVKLPGPLNERLRRFCFAKGISQQDVILAAVVEYLEKPPEDVRGLRAKRKRKHTRSELLTTVIGASGGIRPLAKALGVSPQAVCIAPKIAGTADAAQWGRNVEKRIATAFDAIAGARTFERDQDRERATVLLGQRDSIVAAVHRLAKSGAGSLMTRIHGDFHLGQVLVASGDVYIIDFEGEPAASIAERRAKTSPLRDVAGLLRSIDYAGAALVERKGVGAMPVDEARRDHFVSQFRLRASKAFLRCYWEASCISDGLAARALLDLFLIEKAAYELGYEAANRPTWIGVPLAGLSALVTRIIDEDAGGRHG